MTNRELRKKRRAGIAKVVKFRSLLNKYHYGMSIRGSWSSDNLSKPTSDDNIVMMYLQSFGRLGKDSFKKLWRSPEFCELFFKQCKYHNIVPELPKTLSEYE